jgi:hypothetical protein
MQRPDLRPRSIGEVLDAAFKLLTSNFRPLVTLSAVILLPLVLLQSLAAARLGSTSLFELAAGNTAVDPEAALAEVSRIFGISLLLSLAALVATAVVQAGSIRLFAHRYQGEPSDWQESLEFGVRRLPRVLIAGFLTGVGALVGLLCCVAPGVWLYTSWWVTIPALVTEGLGPVESMRRSFQLVKTRFWPVLAVALLAFLLNLALQQVIGSVVSLAVLTPSFLSDSPSLGMPLAVSTFAGGLVTLVTVPFLAAVATVQYFDLRVRAEGYDLEVMARELDDLDRP